ncbi:Aspartic proteinase yapsin-3 [Madurella mycetomatis]|uniref:Aspartic proteinase yapsin-3 n=1 Tax=Madurella mycetomatis TaxID=100816 RepID=A0A175WDK5_9PEZI|nr:Aspartic proteinase yapsin-3 [Madurella mycetomatis]KXX81869.1 Aspartic proteinase yapsin-3 [Madurella mycetomatis]
MVIRTRLSATVICVLGATTTAAHVLLPFSRRSDIPDPKLTTRASSEQTALTSRGGYAWVVDATVGTPGQRLSLLVSPSAGDTWVPNAEAVGCSPGDYYDADYYEDYEIPSPQCHWGGYNHSNSETYLPANQRYSSFSPTYVDDLYVHGENMTDKLVVGDIEMDDFPMGLVSSASRWIGILGLGHNRSSSAYDTYPTFMDRMVSSGKIASPAYSMWLDNAEGTSGGLLFGAIDQSRYTGELLRLPGRSLYSYSTTLGTTLESINGTTDSGDVMPPIRSNDFPVDVIIGSGELFSFLPEVLADEMASIAGATYNETFGGYIISCDAGRTNSAEFVFELGGSGGPLLSAEMSDLVIPASAVDTGYLLQYWRNETEICFFGVQKRLTYSSYDVYNLGSSLLRRTYLVFDHANDEIALAPARFSSSSDSPSPTIVAFESYGATVPSAVMFCTSGRCASECSTWDCVDPTFTDDPRSNPNFNSSNPDVANWQSVAIGVGVGVGVLILIGAAAAAVIWTRLCLGDRKDAAEKGADEGGGTGSQLSESTQGPAEAQGGNGGMTSPTVTLPPGTLPVIQESPGADKEEPQLPALGTQPTRPITPEATSASNSAAVAVLASSEDQQPQDPAEVAQTSGPGETSTSPMSQKARAKK